MTFVFGPVGRRPYKPGDLERLVRETYERKAKAMTTHVTIKNEDNSNPSQELVVISYNASSGIPLEILKPGQSCER